MSENSLFEVKTYVLPCQHVREYQQALLDNDAEPAFEVKRYVPRQPSAWCAPQNAVAIIAAGGIGMAKECYEALFEDVFARSREQGTHISGFWIADASYMGASALLNENINGNQPNWFDHSRDLLVMVNHFRKELKPPMIGLGHSMGGAQLSMLAILHPALFSSLILIEPPIYANPARTTPFAQAKMMARRRESWPTREEAEAAHTNNPYYQAWDPRALRMQLKHSLYEKRLPDGSQETRTIMSKHTELALVARPNLQRIGAPDKGGLAGMSRGERHLYPDVDPESAWLYPYYGPWGRTAFRFLPYIRPRTLFIDGGTSHVLDPSKFHEQRVARCGTGVGGNGGVAAGQVSHIVIQGARHTMVVDREHLPQVSKIVGKRIADETALYFDDRHQERTGQWWHLPQEERQKFDPKMFEIFRSWNGKDFLEGDELKAAIAREKKRNTKQPGSKQRSTKL